MKAADYMQQVPKRRGFRSHKLNLSGRASADTVAALFSTPAMK